MSETNRAFPNLPPDQAKIRAECFYPSATFVEFKKEEIEQSIPERFETIVAKYPNRMAIKSKLHSLTYDALNKASNRAARAILDAHGIGQEPVALLLENDAPMIISILGALKSRKLYVPLDPSYPFSRLRYLLEDSGSAMMITNDENLRLATELTNQKIPLVNIDAIETVSDDNLHLDLAPDTLAYILYTSGSTGEPKGVVQSHRNVLHLVMRQTNRCRATINDRLALLRSFSVNGGTLHTFTALLNGATILPFDLKTEGFNQLESWLADEKITLCSGLSPTIFGQFAASLSDDRRFPTIRMITFSGEPLQRRHVELCRKYLSHKCVIVNSLGATEASNFCEFVVDRDTPLADGTLPAGYPTADAEVFLVDEDRADIGANRLGEIAVKTPYMALGYWRKPELTATKFIPTDKGRLYLSGDLGLKRDDGCLVHVGRKDFQVKVRGYRVDTGEVEESLLDVENIKEVAVAAREDSTGGKVLVAYIVAKNGSAPSVAALRGILGSKLPDYMVPSKFVFLDALPMTPNGKIDRRALPDPGKARPNLDTPYGPPRTPVEAELAQIWVKVLSVVPVGIYDKFFDLGGHSLAATRIVSQVIEKFHTEIPLQLLFQSPTIVEMAAVITENQAKKLGKPDLNRILSQLESLSDEEAKKLLAGEGPLTAPGDRRD
jgi:amino acid adenylation domain-containing protein